MSVLCLAGVCRSCETQLFFRCCLNRGNQVLVSRKSLIDLVSKHMDCNICFQYWKRKGWSRNHFPKIACFQGRDITCFTCLVIVVFVLIHCTDCCVIQMLSK